MPSSRSCWKLVWLLLAWGTGLEGREDTPQLGLSESLAGRPFLHREQPGYTNYAIQRYTNPPNHAFPYADTPRAYYGPLGDYLITGYELYDWTERRQPGLEYGSSILKDMNVFQQQFEHVMVARDGYSSWGYSAIVGDGLIARFTPLTLSKVDFNGVRLDVATPHVKFSALGSRIDRPNFRTFLIPPWVVDDTHFADASTLLLGNRLQVDAGALKVGMNGVNVHQYQSTQAGNGLKGVLHPQQPFVDWVVVRFSDDSPADGRKGALVQEVELIVNGERRPDLRPLVIRRRANARSQVGMISRATGEFRPTIYNTFSGYYIRTPRFYRGRDEIPLYADYLYRAQHEAGVDVSDITNLPLLLAEFEIEPPGEILRADGDEQLIFMFELSQEPWVESVELTALLGDDYRVESAMLSERDPQARNLAGQFQSTFYRTELQAPGNVQDGSNLNWVRFEVGENTAIFTYSTDVSLTFPGVEVRGEYARSALYSRFPARVGDSFIRDRGRQFSRGGAAYFLNAVHWFERGRVGAEVFSMDPEFTTEMRAFLPADIAHARSPFGGLANDTIYWDLVQDNDDGDRYPDKRVGNVLGLRPDSQERDMDGVFPGQDADNDGFPDINRNGNRTPDYEEPFLLYDVEPNDYFYGLDRNNNDQPDVREDDLDVDYPYDADQEGYHLFGQVDLARHWSFGVGHYSAEQIAGGGGNTSSYALLTYRRDGLHQLRRLFFENNFRRVRDDIPDEFTVWEITQRQNLVQEDLLHYQDSYVKETYLEGHVQPWSGLNLVQKLRLRMNWQQGGDLRGGRVQRSRRLDQWTVVSRADYTWEWGRLRVQPQFKFLTLRLMDRREDRTLRSEYGVVPIMKLEYPLMPRTRLLAGVEGVGPWPYRFKDRANDRNSFERHTQFLTLVNRSKYFGYDLYTTIGFNRNRKEFDDPFQQANRVDNLSFFIRSLVGFTEYGRPF